MAIRKAQAFICLGCPETAVCFGLIACDWRGARGGDNFFACVSTFQYCGVTRSFG
jgi:hypothetical protein